MRQLRQYGSDPTERIRAHHQALKTLQQSHQAGIDSLQSMLELDISLKNRATAELDDIEWNLSSLYGDSENDEVQEGATGDEMRGGTEGDDELTTESELSQTA